MPRTARIELPGYPHHIVQRGHDRNAVFAHQDDYVYCLDTLNDTRGLIQGVRVVEMALSRGHGYCYSD